MIPFVIIVASNLESQIRESKKFLSKIIKDKGLLRALKKDFPFAHPDILVFTPHHQKAMVRGLSPHQPRGAGFISQKPHLGIELVRSLKRNLSRKPYQATQRLVFIPEAEKLTLEAQNALLKTLEEPPKNTFIILTLSRKEALLPTILSRAQIISQKKTLKLGGERQKEYLLLIKKLLKATPGERVLLAEKYSSNREEAIDFCQNLLLFWHQLLLSSSSSLDLRPQKISLAIKNTQRAKSLLEKNINVKLGVEELFLNLPKAKPQPR